jgi:hypothetical protein
MTSVVVVVFGAAAKERLGCVNGVVEQHAGQADHEAGHENVVPVRNVCNFVPVGKAGEGDVHPLIEAVHEKEVGYNLADVEDESDLDLDRDRVRTVEHELARETRDEDAAFLGWRADRRGGGGGREVSVA